MRLSRNLRLAVAIALVGLFCFAGSTVLYAQTTSASVFGAIKDSQGGAMPGASVTLTSRTQAFSLAATTDAEGRFVFPIVRPDHYSLKVTMQGFKTAERTNVVVTANDKFSAGTMQSSRTISPVGEPRMPIFFSSFPSTKPSKSFSTTNALMPRCAAPGSVLANTV